jgi:hypothetical protein
LLSNYLFEVKYVIKRKTKTALTVVKEVRCLTVLFLHTTIPPKEKGKHLLLSSILLVDKNPRILC